MNPKEYGTAIGSLRGASPFPSLGEIGGLAAGFPKVTAGEILHQIPGELEELDKSLAFLTEVVKELENRLQPTLHEEINTDQVQGLPAVVRVPLAERIHQHTLAVQIAAARIHSILDRLEL